MKRESRNAIHTNFYKGKKVWIIMRDGSTLVDKFLESHSTYLVFQSAGRIPIKKIRSATIYKGIE